MRLLVLGSSGFIGSHLTRYAITQDQEVIALCRSGTMPEFEGETFAWQLGEPIPSQALEKVDCAVHLVHDFSGNEGAQLTRESTLVCINQIRDAGVKRQFFFSSYSAGQHSESLYGQTKFQIECAIENQPDVTVIRPGLVLGDGGLYGRIRRYAAFLPVIPMPDGGHGKVPVILLGRLSEETLKLVRMDSPPAEMNLFEAEFKSLKQLVVEAAEEAGRRPWLIPIPSRLIIAGLRVGAILHIPLPVNADNLIGFLANQQADHTSMLSNK